MKYVIWGAGSRGGRLFRHLRGDDVIAFVDKESDKIGKFYCGKEVISLDKYIEAYSNAILIITHTFEQKAIEELESRGVKNYMRLSDCPGEFQEENARPFLCDHIKSLVNSEETYGILGCTVYGLEVYTWLSEIGNDHSYLILDKNIPTKVIELIKENGYRTIEEDEVTSECIDSVLNCKYVEGTAYNQGFKGIGLRDIYDCSDEIEEYYNPAIEKLKGIHKNQRCFIVATGPSLRMDDLDILADNNILTFGVNKIGYAYGSTKWRPTYYVGIDRRMVESEYFTNIKPEEQSIYAFIGDESEEFWNREHKPCVLKHHFSSEWAFGRYPKFSEDIARKTYTGGTIVYICIQIAVYMGFKEIYLLGVDFTGANEHGSKYGHFYAEKELVSVSYTDQVKAAYGKAQKYADEHGIKIYNATRGGKLEIFERVNFDELFSSRTFAERKRFGEDERGC